MIWDFGEMSFAGMRGLSGAFNTMLEVFDSGSCRAGRMSSKPQLRVTLCPMTQPAIITDPPYYDAVPYRRLVGLLLRLDRRTVERIRACSRDCGVPKDAEIVVDRPHQLSQSNKNIAFYDGNMQKALRETRRVLRPDGVGNIVFASKTTSSWEAILKAVVDAGWIITGSWPIDTEMETRVAAGAGTPGLLRAFGLSASRGLPRLVTGVMS